MIYERLPWPEYQEYMTEEGFDEHSCYDPLDNTYFIEKSWLDHIITQKYW